MSEMSSTEIVQALTLVFNARFKAIEDQVQDQQLLLEDLQDRMREQENDPKETDILRCAITIGHTNHWWGEASNRHFCSGVPESASAKPAFADILTNFGKVTELTAKLLKDLGDL